MAEQVVTILDIVNPEYVEVIFGPDGKTVWVNVEGITRFRARRIETLSLSDERSHLKELKHVDG